MSLKRYLYILKTENGKVTRNPICYKYGSTRISLYLTSKDFYLTYERPKYDNSCLEDNYIKDALKKVELLYLVRYGKRAKYRKLFLIIGEENFILWDKQKDATIVYSMIIGSMILKMAPEWRCHKILSFIANTAKSSYDRRFSALFALLIAKSKDFETEKFMYLWMAMNGLYGHIANLYKEIKDLSNRKRKELDKESKQIRMISDFWGYAYRSQGNRAINNTLREKIIDIIESICDDEYDTILRKINNNSWEESHLRIIQSALKEYGTIEEMDSFSFFHFWLPYQMRCKYFHGEKDVPLLSFAEERPIKSLRFLNKLLESLLDEELVKWFDGEVVECEFIPKLKSLDF